METCLIAIILFRQMISLEIGVVWRWHQDVEHGTNKIYSSFPKHRHSNVVLRFVHQKVYHVF